MSPEARPASAVPVLKRWGSARAPTKRPTRRRQLWKRLARKVRTCRGSSSTTVDSTEFVPASLDSPCEASSPDPPAPEVFALANAEVGWQWPCRLELWSHRPCAVGKLRRRCTRRWHPSRWWKPDGRTGRKRAVSLRMVPSYPGGARWGRRSAPLVDSRSGICGFG